MSQQPNTQPWEPGIIARYLTAAGATVDITATHTEREEGEHGLKDLGNGLSYATRPVKVVGLTLTAQCHGCTENTEDLFEGKHPSVLDHPLEGFRGEGIRRWVQSHAEKCRALRPAVTA